MTTLIILLYFAVLAVSLGLHVLNNRHLKRYGHQVPTGFEAVIDPETLAKSSDYTLAKGRFGLARFAQGTRKGVYRFLVLSLLAFVLAQWGTWEWPGSECLDWGVVTTQVRLTLVPDLVEDELTAQLERLRPYLVVAEVPVGT